MKSTIKNRSASSTRLLTLALGALIAAFLLQVNFVANATTLNRRSSQGYVVSSNNPCDKNMLVKVPNLPPLIVATKEVPINEEDIKAAVAKAIQEQGKCDCICSCSTTQATAVCTESTVTVPLCPCPTTAVAVPTACSTEPQFPEYFKQMLNQMNITACVPHQAPCCDNKALVNCA